MAVISWTLKDEGFGLVWHKCSHKLPKGEGRLWHHTDPLKMCQMNDQMKGETERYREKRWGVKNQKSLDCLLCVFPTDLGLSEGPQGCVSHLALDRAQWRNQHT